MRARPYLPLPLLTLLLGAACTGSAAAPACGDQTCLGDASAGADHAGSTGGTSGGGATDGAAAADGAGTVPGLVALYGFDETSGTVALDSSGNFNNAGLIGAINRATGHQGGDASLLGGYVLLPPDLLDGAREATLAAWVKLRTNTQAWQRIFDFGSGMGAYMFLTPRSDPKNTLRFAITSNGVSYEEIMDAPELPVSTWKHVAVVLSATGGVLYVDGQPVATNTAMTLRPADIAPMTNDWIGRSQYSYDPPLDGEVDQVRVYSRALSASEIAALAVGP